MPSLRQSSGSRFRSAAFPALSLVYLLAIFWLPLFACKMALREAGTAWPTLALLMCPFLYSLAFALVAGLLSIPHQRGIIPGRFPRTVSNNVYFHRRLYGLCWTALFYFKPVYYLVLMIDPLRRCVFRIFGYRGSLNFTVYPDTWIRDLPLLKLGNGAYISNRATLGTNLVLTNGRILSDFITVEDGACVGHMSMLAPGVHVGRKAEVGVGCGIGIQTRIGDNAKVGPTSVLEHAVHIGAGTMVGTMAFIGSGSNVGPNLSIPAASLIPSRSRVTTISEARSYLSSTASFRCEGKGAVRCC